MFILKPVLWGSSSRSHYNVKQFFYIFWGVSVLDLESKLFVLSWFFVNGLKPVSYIIFCKWIVFTNTIFDKTVPILVYVFVYVLLKQVPTVHFVLSHLFSSVRLISIEFIYLKHFFNLVAFQSSAKFPTFLPLTIIK